MRCGEKEELKQIEQKLTKVQDRNNTLKKENLLLKEKVLDLEYRQRRNNLIFDGISDAQKETDLDCIRKLRFVLRNIPGIDVEGFRIDRCLRLDGSFKLGTKRRIICCFNWFYDVQCILHNHKLLPTGVYVTEDLAEEWVDRRKGVSFTLEVEFEFTTWAWVQATAEMNISEVAEGIMGRLIQCFNWTRGSDYWATAECHFGGGLNSSSGGELKLYLGCTGSTRKVLKPIFNAAKRDEKLKQKMFLSKDRLIIDGRSFTVAPVNNVAEASGLIDMASTCQRSNEETVLFLGSHSPLSNLYSSNFTFDNRM